MFIIFFGCGCRCHCQFANVKEKAKVRQMIGPLLNFGTTYHSPLIHQFPRKGSQLHFTICFDLYLQFTTKNHRQTNNPGVPRSSSLSILVAAVKYNLAMHTPDFRFSQMNSSPVTNRCCVACGYVTMSSQTQYPIETLLLLGRASSFTPPSFLYLMFVLEIIRPLSNMFLHSLRSCKMGKDYVCNQGRNHEFFNEWASYIYQLKFQ